MRGGLGNRGKDNREVVVGRAVNLGQGMPQTNLYKVQGGGGGWGLENSGRESWIIGAGRTGK